MIFSISEIYRDTSKTVKKLGKFPELYSGKKKIIVLHIHIVLTTIIYKGNKTFFDLLILLTSHNFLHQRHTHYLHTLYNYLEALSAKTSVHVKRFKKTKHIIIIIIRTEANVNANRHFFLQIIYKTNTL